MAADVRVSEASREILREYARVSIAFEVRAVLEVVETPGGVVTRERSVERPWVKDYDAHPDERPTSWPRRFDVARWGFLVAHDGDALVGGATVAHDTPTLDRLAGRRDVAALWDLRVAASARGRGVGHALFAAAEAWARRRGCRALEVETQDVNVPACRFYARQGCTLRAVNRGVYPQHPDEAQLIWGKDLTPPKAVIPT